MNKPLRRAIFIFWAIIFLFLLYMYFMHPDLFYQMFNYQGPGSPFVQPP